MKISAKLKLSIKRQIKIFEDQGKKINCSKLEQACNISASIRTLQRHMKRQGMQYKKSKVQIVLSAKHKQKQIEKISAWISTNHSWEKTIYSDEKHFSLYGSDD